MFGRRRPVLGAAVVIGASRSAARREVANQTLAQQNAQLQANQAAQNAAAHQQQAQLQAQQQAQYEAEQRKREDDENARRTQLAIDEAIAKERARGEGERGYGQYGGGQPQQQFAGQQQQLRNAGGGGYAQEYAPPYSQLEGAGGMGDVKGGVGVVAGTRYCGNCGNQCRTVDKFCNACGARQVVDGA